MSHLPRLPAPLLRLVAAVALLACPTAVLATPAQDGEIAVGATFGGFHFPSYGASVRYGLSENLFAEILVSFANLGNGRSESFGVIIETSVDSREIAPRIGYRFLEGEVERLHPYVGAGLSLIHLTAEVTGSFDDEVITQVEESANVTLVHAFAGAEYGLDQAERFRAAFELGTHTTSTFSAVGVGGFSARLFLHAYF